MASHNPRESVRQDIQALRGFAVLIVVLYHAGLGFAGGGFLGVDVFFVISGYLVTRLIQKALERGDFSFGWFYYRRARRLLPAAFVTFAAVAAAAPLLLGASELHAFRAQLLGALGFAENFVLWRQAGYFDGAAELKPLLHVWSLSLEEQFYFLLPALLVFLPRRFWLPAATLLAIASLALCLWLVVRKPAAAFYLLPTRGWELAMGSIATLLPAQPWVQRVARFAFWPALAALLLVPWLRLSDMHPGPDAIVVCLATAVVILRQHPVLQRGHAIRGLAWMGDLSYSLYLVHWPLFAFLHNAWQAAGGAEPPLAWRLGLALASLPLAVALHRWVEEPLRHPAPARSPRRFAAAMGTITLVLAGAAFAVAKSRGDGPDFLALRQPNYGLGAECSQPGPFSPSAACASAEAPNTLVWGDSFAMHLVPGIARSRAVVQATRNTCAPLLDLAPVERRPKAGTDPAWARQCMAFNDSVVDWLERHPAVRTVVLSSIFEHLIDDANFALLLREAEGEPRLGPAGERAVRDALARTVARLRSMGRKVVLVGPPPKGGFDMGTCVERVQSGLPVLGVGADCAISVDAYRRTNARVVAFVRTAAAAADVPLVDFEPCLCDAAGCRTSLDGELLYADAGHFSRNGSVNVAAACGVEQSISSGAR